jgi:two-component system, chemotaxis family, chemotaxis protein CheY
MAKIMIVDDSETLRTQLRKILHEAGHDTVEAENGVEGLEQFTATKDLQLILCDVNMPEMDGLTMCEKLFNDAEYNDRKVPIFMLTTESSAEMKVRGKAVGVLAWVTKPFVEAKLLGAVTKVLARFA